MSDRETPRPCARGCVWHPQGQEEEPRQKPAAHGVLCNSCFFRVATALRLVPDVIAHMRAQLLTIRGANFGARITGGGDRAAAPLDLATLDEADALFAKLRSWVGVFADELDVASPTVPAWANAREVQGMRPMSAERAYVYAGALCDWLSQEAEAIAASTSAAAFHDDLVIGWEDSSGIFTLARASGVDLPRANAAMNRECPVCGSKEIQEEMPSSLDADYLVVCRRCRWREDETVG